MFALRRPSPSTIDNFVESSRFLPLSYGPVGLAVAPAPGFSVDELAVEIGRGSESFGRARSALANWEHFKLGWLEIAPPNAPVVVGSVGAVVIRHCGFSSLNGFRIVAVVDEPCRFSFSYGTLTNHAERGEELFEVALDGASGPVTYRIRAASQPRAWFARLGYPLARLLQARCRRESAHAMLRGF